MRSLLLVLCLPVAVSSAQSRGAHRGPALVPDPEPVTYDLEGRLGKPYLIQSVVLQERRRIYLTLPASFKETAADRRFPVTVVVDGEDLPEPVAAVSRHLAEMGQMPESIILGIENTNRLRDLTPPGISVSGSSTREGGDRFLDFIEQELLPAVERQFRGGAPRTFVGHSSGGILATYAAATRPGFRVVVAIDTPTWFADGWLTKQLISRAERQPGELRYASLEARFGWSDHAWRALTNVAPTGWKLRREHLENESHESLAMLGAYLGLRAVFSDYSSLAAPTAPTTSTLPYYAAVGASLGAAVIPPRKLLRDVVEDLVMEGRGKEARTAYRMLSQDTVPPLGPPSLTVASPRRKSRHHLRKPWKDCWRHHPHRLRKCGRT